MDAEFETRVEYALEEHEHGTRLTVVESGFAALPEAIGKRSRTDRRALARDRKNRVSTSFQPGLSLTVMSVDFLMLWSLVCRCPMRPS